jgi:cyclic lactone autoinducer peptide
MMNYFVELLVRVFEMIANAGVASNSFFLWHEPEIPESLTSKVSKDE